ncbi:hypothetical protein BDV96DRAFT_575066 [Lophiotrema nucula]|uniref:Uncharacterized protein n=1 Tax=Lophiotrema nucula TaxID=690887 RepID=A0A6A5Z6Z5_9PLEO|nr:hypothetical protein BDV96DRAFT_575066 [Lophiotrema nucula]
MQSSWQRTKMDLALSSMSGGDIQNGMEYESRQIPQKPDLSNTFVSKSHLGWVKVEDLSRIDSICRANPAPAKQFNGPRRINPNKPLQRCQEWTSETIGILRVEGILRNSSSSTAGGSGLSNDSVSSSVGYSTAAPSHGTEPRDGETKDGYWYWSSQHRKWYHRNDNGTYIYS